MACSLHSQVASGKWRVAGGKGGKVAGAANSASHYLKLLLCITQRKLIMIISLLNATSTYRCPSSHTHRHTQLGVCVCVRACNCIDTLFTIDFTRLHSRLFKEKNFLMPSSANKTHTHTRNHTHTHTAAHTHSGCYIHVSARSYASIHLFSNSAHSFRRSRLPFHFIPSFLIPSRLLLLLLAASYLLK